jgi:hypothetical protein
MASINNLSFDEMSNGLRLQSRLFFFSAKLSSQSHQGCQIFLCETFENIPNVYKIYLCIVHKIYKMTVRIPNGYKIYQRFPFQGLPKYLGLGTFGLKNIPSGNPESHVFGKLLRLTLRQGCQMAYIFSNQKFQFGSTLKGLGMEICTYITAI